MCAGGRDVDNAGSLLNHQVVYDAISQVVLLLEEVIRIPSIR